MPRLFLPVNPWELSVEGMSWPEATSEGIGIADFATRLFGFLLGSFLSGSAAYSYLLKEYKTANDLLTEDIYVCSQEGEAIDRPGFTRLLSCSR